MESTGMQRVTTFEGMEGKITPRRRDGNTTRLVDNAIQILFRGDICVVLDHHEWGRNHRANKNLFDAILERLHREHRFIFEQRRVKIDRGNLEIRFVEDPIFDELKLGTGVNLNNI
jgi:hypothetical protein